MRTLLVIGAGDVARRALPLLLPRWRVLVLCRSQDSAVRWRALGALPLLGDLDCADSLARLAGLADAVLLTAPPPPHGGTDPRMRKLLYALAKADSIPQQWIYISTSGVYGDAGGEWLDETAPLRPRNERARRRVDAESQLRRLAASRRCALTILRAPGIYADERLPLARFASGAPLIIDAEDSWSNHIHADDLALLCAAALRRRSGIRVYNACDDQPLPVSRWYRALGETLGLPCPPQLPRAEAKAAASPQQWSFLAESRRLDNSRLRRELGVRLRWPSVLDYLAALARDPARREAILASYAKIR
ncbi:NAD(P)-dependent oxidoreductase [Chromobacterium phragmitis]|uniref:NAD-dependent epimerase/dehydratase family protein n=1 Tax=Chromobacterium phragmitis TaxID=2202141 RepID=UPI000DEC197A|nr:NAD-dependent epimerase/dehydratase family protein [Chromobacterium phragmitis]AXE29164.1 NAD(P)-dependent oxidoreductase [Chromobacterium phragmitis]